MFEHLLSNTKNIKKSLYCVTNYIKNKSIKSNKANDVPDLKGIGETLYSFISTIYKSGWDLLIANKDNWLFQ